MSGTKFKVGDKVRYIGNETPNLHGREGTVIRISEYGDCRTRVDFGKGYPDYGVFDKSVEPAANANSTHEWYIPDGTVIKSKSFGAMYLSANGTLYNMKDGRDAYEGVDSLFRRAANAYDVHLDPTGTAFIREKKTVYPDETIARYGQLGLRIKVKGEWYVLTKSPVGLSPAMTHPENGSDVGWEIVYNPTATS